MPKKNALTRKRKGNALARKRKFSDDESEEAFDEEESEESGNVLLEPKTTTSRKRKANALEKGKAKATETQVSGEPDIELIEEEETGPTEELETEELENEVFASQAKKRRTKKNALTSAEEEEEETEEAPAQEETEVSFLTGEARVRLAELTKRSIDIGRSLRGKLEAAPIDSDRIDGLIETIQAQTGVQKDALGWLGPRKHQFGKKDGQLFDKKYRDHASKMDELVSTATVRDLLLGMLKRTASDDVMERVRNLVDLMSVLRVPSQYVGLATEEHHMQHPTVQAGGTYGTKQHEHNKRD